MYKHNNSSRKFITQLALLGICCIAAPAQGDATLVYQTVNADGDSMQHTFAISGRFVRVETDTEPDRYQVIDAGLLTMADVDTSGKRYTFEKLPRGNSSAAQTTDKSQASGESEEKQVAEQADKAGAVLSPTPTLSPTRKKQNVSGILCRVVREIAAGKPVAEHCMAGTGPLGVTSREMITLSRLFTAARRLQLGWAGVATADERIATVDSRIADSKASQTLLSVSYDHIPDERMQVSKQYKRVKSLEARQETPEAKPEAKPEVKPESPEGAPEVTQAKPEAPETPETPEAIPETPEGKPQDGAGS